MRKENILRENYRSKAKSGKNGSSGSFRRSTLRFRRFAGRHIRWFGQSKVQRNVKDRLFRFLFDKDREALLQLYNALNGTEYQDASQLQVVTIESAVYVVMKNDLAFILAGTLSLYEHQSTYNANMPVRFLIYLAEEYQKLIEQAETSLYGTRRIMLPVPQCVVFYNGEKDAPEEEILRLSDAFANKTQDAAVELRVRMLNINYGHNRSLMDKCHVLEEYAQFVEISRQYMGGGMPVRDALESAVQYCLEHGILYDTLRNYRSEVLGMLLEEFDVDKYERTIRMEGLEEGREQGIELGIERSNRLTKILIEQDRMKDIEQAIQDPDYQKKLFREFNL